MSSPSISVLKFGTAFSRAGDFRTPRAAVARRPGVALRAIFGVLPLTTQRVRPDVRGVHGSDRRHAARYA